MSDPCHATDDSARWRILALLAAAELLGMSLWFTGNAVAPQLTAQWALTGTQVGWLTTVVQLGFVTGTALAALLNLADIVPARRLFAGSALAGAAANAMLVIAPSFSTALASRFLTGMCLAGVYPPAMKMAATWFRERRGLAIGTVVGALTIGKATPYLVHAFPSLSWQVVVLAASVAAVIAGLLVAGGYRDGPFHFPARPFSWGLVDSVVRDRRWRLATGGYLGHMAELYAFWTWIPAYLVASVRMRGGAAGDHAGLEALSFAVIAMGGAGCVWGGLVADRAGRARLVTLAMLASGSCAALIGVAFGRSLWVLAPIALVWGFFVVADSAQFSALVTETVPAHAVGTALTIQTSLGFLLTIATIQLVPFMAARIGWQWSFVLLAAGPLAGILSIRSLVRSAHA